MPQIYVSSWSCDLTGVSTTDCVVTGTSTATTTVYGGTISDVSFGLAVIIVILSLMLAGFVYNNLTDKKTAWP